MSSLLLYRLLMCFFFVLLYVFRNCGKSFLPYSVALHFPMNDMLEELIDVKQSLLIGVKITGKDLSVQAGFEPGTFRTTHV